VIHYRLDESFVTSQIHVLRHCCEASCRFTNGKTSKVIQCCIHKLLFWRHSLIYLTRDYFNFTVGSLVVLITNPLTLIRTLFGLSVVSLQDCDNVRAYGCSVELLQSTYVCKSHGWLHNNQFVSRSIDQSIWNTNQKPCNKKSNLLLSNVVNESVLCIATLIWSPKNMCFQICLYSSHHSEVWCRYSFSVHEDIFLWVYYIMEKF
jgi:hypothetical protein